MEKHWTTLFLSFPSGLKCHDSTVRGLFGNTKMQLGRSGLGHILHQIDLTEEGFPNKIGVVLTEDWNSGPQLGEPVLIYWNRDSDI